jgi:SAM-dependent methyltransferase
MSISDEYKRQFGWRDWPAVFEAIPSVQGQTILDLGCGVGDIAAELVHRGARVIGVDIYEEFLREARSRQLRNAEFRTGDLRTLPDLGVQADGIWSSFTPAYFPDLSPALAAWTKNLKPAGWIALTEIDDLFGHEPLRAETRALLAAYAEDALAAGRYDFFMGRKLKHYLERSGFFVSKVLTLNDSEFSFEGPASPDVLDAWKRRFNRMTLLRDFCGPRMDEVQNEFHACLMRSDHRSLAKVYCCIATANS